MTIAYLYAESGFKTAMKKTTVRYFNGPDFLKKLDEGRKELLDKWIPEQPSDDRDRILSSSRSLRTYVDTGMCALWNWYKLKSGEDKKMQSVTEEDILDLIEELDYKSSF